MSVSPRLGHLQRDWVFTRPPCLGLSFCVRARFDLRPPSDRLGVPLGGKRPHLFPCQRNQYIFLISQNVFLLISLQLTCGAAFRIYGPIHLWICALFLWLPSSLPEFKS